MRKLAKTLSVEATAPYNHVQNKTDILDGVRQTLCALNSLIFGSLLPTTVGFTLPRRGEAERDFVRELELLINGLVAAAASGPGTAWPLRGPARRRRDR